MSLPSQTQLAYSPVSVVGYHGCHRDVAERVQAGEPFLASANGYDWLGSGVYFWEYAPFRAEEWAKKRYGSDGAVLKATITLGRCLNLLDTAHFTGLRQAYETTVQQMHLAGITIPKNTHTGKHYLDRTIVEAYCLDYAAVTGEPLQTVRGGFPEGEPVFPGSKILRETHLQVAVRDEACISDVEMVLFT